MRVFVAVGLRVQGWGIGSRVKKLGFGAFEVIILQDCTCRSNKALFTRPSSHWELFLRDPTFLQLMKP